MQLDSRSFRFAAQPRSGIAQRKSAKTSLNEITCWRQTKSTNDLRSDQMKFILSTSYVLKPTTYNDFEPARRITKTHTLKHGFLRRVTMKLLRDFSRLLWTPKGRARLAIHSEYFLHEQFVRAFKSNIRTRAKKKKKSKQTTAGPFVLPVKRNIHFVALCILSSLVDTFC